MAMLVYRRVSIPQISGVLRANGRIQTWFAADSFQKSCLQKYSNKKKAWILVGHYSFWGTPTKNFPRQLFFRKLPNKKHHQPPFSGCRTRLKISKVSLDERPKSCDKLKNRPWTWHQNHGDFYTTPGSLTAKLGPEKWDGWEDNCFAFWKNICSGANC